MLGLLQDIAGGGVIGVRALGLAAGVFVVGAAPIYPGTAPRCWRLRANGRCARAYCCNRCSFGSAGAGLEGCTREASTRRRRDCLTPARCWRQPGPADLLYRGARSRAVRALAICSASPLPVAQPLPRGALLNSPVAPLANRAQTAPSWVTAGRWASACSRSSRAVCPIQGAWTTSQDGLLGP